MTEVRWVNFYPPCDDVASGDPWRTTPWVTRELADAYARSSRVACVRVEFDHGQGLKEESPPHRMVLTSSAVLDAAIDAAIAAERGDPVPNLGLTEATDSRAIDLLWHAAGGAASTLRTISDLRAYVREHATDKDFLLALHRQMPAHNLMEISL